jgi:N-carbamoyl-L-amino-acid hydrolase
MKIDPAPLVTAIDALAAISEAPAPVVTRVLFSEADVRGRNFVKARCAELGLTVREDAVGNLFARWTGSEPALGAVGTGSHIDAIPNAGRYDGVVGVLGALEAFEALKNEGFQPKRSLELIVFTAEEPTRFGIGCLGSRLLAGAVSPDQLAALKDSDGISVQAAAETAGYGKSSVLNVALPKDAYDSFVELHIEQGPILEKENLPIGIVTHIAAPATLRVLVEGDGGHAGAVLMKDRRDALVAGAEIAVAVDKIARTVGGLDTVATTGIFKIEPGAVNSIPFRTELKIDVRDIYHARRDQIVQLIREETVRVAQDRNVAITFEILNLDPPAKSGEKIVGALEKSCRQLGLDFKKMPSRAYHDSLFMAQVCPTAMVFIPCRNGWSHRPDEYSSPEHLASGVAVLTETLRTLSLS